MGAVAWLVGSACLLIVVAACGAGKASGLEQRVGMPEKAIEVVLEQAAERFMALPGVVGVAQGECSGLPCVRVLVAKKTPELLDKIPSVLEGYVVEVDETGAIRALDDG